VQLPRPVNALAGGAALNKWPTRVPTFSHNVKLEAHAFYTDISTQCLSEEGIFNFKGPIICYNNL
jgi:hypothetical protein